jgi:hypothetical protein
MREEASSEIAPLRGNADVNNWTRDMNYAGGGVVVAHSRKPAIGVSTDGYSVQPEEAKDGPRPAS